MPVPSVHLPNDRHCVVLDEILLPNDTIEDMLSMQTNDAFKLGGMYYTLDCRWCNLFLHMASGLRDMGTCLHFVTIANYFS